MKPNLSNMPDLPEFSDYLQHDDIEQRRLWLVGEIVEADLGLMQTILRYNYWDEGIPIEERKPILLFIDSPGGLLSVSYAIANCVRESATPVCAINMGACDSGAAFIFTSCKYRAALDYTSFLLHLGSGGTVGTYQQTKAMQADYIYRVEQMKKMIFSGLGLPEEMHETFDRLIDGEWALYMSDTDPDSEHNATRFNLTNRKFNFENLQVE